MLYPQSNAYRDVYNLNGIWRFKAVEENYLPLQAAVGTGFMPVPASYNELTTDRVLRDHVGKVLYEREFSVPVRENRLFRLRIGATSHQCKVYLNGEEIGEGINGFFPIDLPLENLKKVNRLSVLIDNRLTFQTLPTGNIENGKQIITQDFYNFTGIHRDVLVYAVNENYIEDIEIKTVYGGDYEKVKVHVKTGAKAVRLTVLDRDKKVVAQSDTDMLTIKNPRLWSPSEPYLYTLVAETENDEYAEKFGIRKVHVTEKGIFLNDQKVYLKGFGMHEDFFLLGKGNNSAVNIRNFELLKWINANSFRTSHYPYSEEIMDLADEYGIMVIDEVPAVGMNWWAPDEGKHWFDDGAFRSDRINDTTKALHKELIKRLIERDKNHPCVIALSVANEAATHEKAAYPYFKDVIGYARNVCDLPITIIEYTKFQDYEYMRAHDGNYVGDLVDFIGLNRYYGWYYDHGYPEAAYTQLKKEMENYYETFKKPIFITEFGADTIEGLHALPSETFSEEYQREYLQENCRAIDECDFCIGEHVWNFADFKTKQGLTRIRGNRKGVFTKDRQPKLAAHYLRERWRKK